MMPLSLDFDENLIDYDFDTSATLQQNNSTLNFPDAVNGTSEDAASIDPASMDIR